VAAYEFCELGRDETDRGTVGGDPDSTMYVGRLLVAAPGVGAYRVSSRSFPNRRIDAREDRLTVGPTPEAPETDNPYVSYNCVREVESPAGEPLAAIGNGSHVDPVAEKLELGYPARDALATPLLALDFEKDDYDTPRIAAVVGADAATVGIVRRDALLVEAVSAPTLLATYERDRPEGFAFEARTAAAAAREAYDLGFEHPVCAAGVAVDGEGVETAIANDEG
jgi:IMP cyclohydrolase